MIFDFQQHIIPTCNYENDIHISTSCRRAAATICPRPSPPSVGAECATRRRADRCACRRQRSTVNTFSRWPLQLP